MGGCKKLMLFFGGFFCWGRGLATLLLFLYVTEEAGRKYVRDMPWPPAAECNMITNKQNYQWVISRHSIGKLKYLDYVPQFPPRCPFKKYLGDNMLHQQGDNSAE